ncbi:hypothetical protein B0H16DRAFT_273561 [Mycena metata]|uniref:Uncharacterized protein n=1 Tax=Mycena metata TaxID=1033252 RepID=A0AAD7NNZ2_9AGAR|nr:hypothetical protein B0H16DRAFT_273561 [Mycena metata]
MCCHRESPRARLLLGGRGLQSPGDRGGTQPDSGARVPFCPPSLPVLLLPYLLPASTQPPSLPATSPRQQKPRRRDAKNTLFSRTPQGRPPAPADRNGLDSWTLRPASSGSALRVQRGVLVLEDAGRARWLCSRRFLVLRPVLLLAFGGSLILDTWFCMGSGLPRVMDRRRLETRIHAAIAQYSDSGRSSSLSSL